MDYTITKNTKGILSPDEVHFFYYDIMHGTEDSVLSICDWNYDIQQYLNTKGLVIEEKKKDKLPINVEKNKLYFTIGKNDKNNKVVAFFRHLRNAFAHFRIVNENGYLNIEDGNSKKSMMGQIKYEDLKELCFLFFKQRDKFIEENNI